MPEQFRFWGRRDPRGRAKPPIVAAIDAPAVDEQGAATLRLFDPIDSWGGDWGVSAKEFAAALDQIPDAREIRLHINSPGGEVFDAVTILNALRAHPARVVATVEGLAASAASFIAAGADELVMRRNTELMIHDAWGIAIGPAEEMHRTGDVLDRLSGNIASIYADKAGGTVEHWRGLMVDETWLSADEAVAAGLADRVDGAPATDEAAAAARFDLSAFRASGRLAGEPRITERQAATDDGARAARFAARRHAEAARRHGLSLPA